jgi:hypothetical protein
MYARLSEFKAYKGLSASETTDDRLLESFLASATKAISTYCGRTFEARTQTRYFESDALDPFDRSLLWVDDDLLTVTGLTNGDSAATAITSSYYWLWPRNGGCFYGIRLKSTATSGWQFDTDYFVTVTGTWGYSATPPDDVTQACLRWTAFLYDQKDAPTYDTTAFPASGVISIPAGIPADVQKLLNPYRRLTQ